MTAEEKSVEHSRWPLTGRDLVAAITVAVAIVGLVAVAVGLEAAQQVRLARERAAAKAAAEAAGPKRAPPITRSVFVRAVPVRRAG